MPEDHKSSGNYPRTIGRHHGPLQKIRALLSPKGANSPTRLMEDHVLSILASRRGRELTFGRELFADPAWDVLLELYAANLGKRRIGLQDLARSIDIPETTTARWITALVKRGWVISTSDGEKWIELSHQGASEMERLLGYWGTAFRSI